jgi:hypothetical protein
VWIATSAGHVIDKGGATLNTLYHRIQTFMATHEAKDVVEYRIASFSQHAAVIRIEWDEM